MALSYIGLAAAIGHSCDIPYIIRQLALYLNASKDGDPLVVDRDFLLLLDSGSDSEDHSAVVDSYHLPWWTSPKPPTNENFLNWPKIQIALDYHVNLKTIDNIPSININKLKYTWPRHVSIGARDMSPDCNKCRLYRGVSLGILDNLHDLRHHVQGLEESFKTHAEQTERRAAGFFQLYDSSLMKEQTVDPNQSFNRARKGQPKSQLAEVIRSEAAAELSRLQLLPSLKWTWGPDLTKEDISKLGKPPLPSLPYEHSGYHISLPYGRYGKDSDDLDFSSVSQRFSDIADDNMDIPELLPEKFPFHFLFHPLRPEIEEAAVSTLPLPPSNYLFPVPPQILVKRSAMAQVPATADAFASVSDDLDANPADAFGNFKLLCSL